MSVDTWGKTKGIKDDVNLVATAVVDALDKVIAAKIQESGSLRHPDWKRCKIIFNPGEHPTMWINFTYNGEGRQMFFSFRTPFCENAHFPEDLRGEDNTFSWHISVWGSHEEIMDIVNQAVKSVTRNPVYYQKDDCSGDNTWYKVRKRRVVA